MEEYSGYGSLLREYAAVCVPLYIIEVKEAIV